ncbi:MAG TPA: 16S rRNA (guanine(966)-N(2))-methyltransferase RsmD [Candidatus Limnocylindria bacterium]|nr:16S rRNA (guanine(966)-N(2))-methyltransferase RsmD [Candidatus Limnocylindria bacterium]
MRVIAGSAGGIALTAPRGDATRPVTDRVKETLFGILGDRVLDARVVDLYAGSGALGVEALSRGAAHATFVEHDRRALVAIRENLERTRLAASASVHGLEVARYLASAGDQRFDLAFLDPPYEERDILAPLERLAPLLAPGATVVVKHFWRTDVPAPPGLAVARRRRFGETVLTFLETDAVEEPPP